MGLKMQMTQTDSEQKVDLLTKCHLKMNHICLAMQQILKIKPTNLCFKKVSF